jgi:hypothetical protein
MATRGRHSGVPPRRRAPLVFSFFIWPPAAAHYHPGAPIRPKTPPSPTFTFGRRRPRMAAQWRPPLIPFPATAALLLPLAAAGRAWPPGGVSRHFLFSNHRHGHIAATRPTPCPPSFLFSNHRHGHIAPTRPAPFSPSFLFSNHRRSHMAMSLSQLSSLVVAAGRVPLAPPLLPFLAIMWPRRGPSLIPFSKHRFSHMAMFVW